MVHLRVFPRGRSRGTRLAASLALIASFALALQMAPTANADQQLDELKKQSSSLKAAIGTSNDTLDAFSNELNKAADTLAQSQTDLADAQATEAAAESARNAAEAEDARLADELDKANQDVVNAQKAVAQGRQDLEAEKKLIGQAARRTQQQAGPLQGLAAFTTDIGTGDIVQKAQWANQIFNSTQNQMDRLEAAQMKLEAAEQSSTQAQQRVQQLRDDAAQNLQIKKDAEAQANDARDQIAVLVVQNQQAKDAANAQLVAEQKRNADLQAEQASVDQRVKDRIAQLKKEEEERKAEAARKAAEAKKAAAEAAAAKKKAEQAAAAQAAQAKKDAAAKAAAAKKKQAEADAAKKKADDGRSSTVSRSTSRSTSSSTGLQMPVNGPITSPYGMRFHPILHVNKLHDGMDIGAACGTPIRAAADGVVAERYFNSGYGNRLMIDHGKINGSYITTGYNHAQSYVVSVGQRVTKGQVIGYVGTTGFSTGCHLHLMVWDDGTVVNPAPWF